MDSEVLSCLDTHGIVFLLKKIHIGQKYKPSGIDSYHFIYLC